MTGTGEADWWQTVRYLLAASRSKIDSQHSTSLLLSVSAALANLFFCVLFENPIREDPSGRSLSLFLFIQGSLILLLTLAHLATIGTEVLRKSLVMPVAPSARLAFAIVSSARHPVLQALILSDVFFLLVLYHQSAGVIIFVPFLAGLMAADIVALTALGSVAAIRRSRPPTMLAAYCILGILGIAILALLLHMPGPLLLLPPMSWAAQGIVASVGGETEMALLCAAASIALLLITGILGRRIA